MIQWIQRRLQARRIRQITEANARERAARGATYLDDVDPGWHARIDPETLELSSGRACVLGQLHGDFRLGLGRARLLNLSSAPRPSLSPVAYGFRCVQNVPSDAQDQDYTFLNRAWKSEICDRRSSSKQAHEAAPDAHSPSAERSPTASSERAPLSDTRPTDRDRRRPSSPSPVTPDAPTAA